MDKNVKVLIVLGAAGVGIYILYKGGYLAQWFPQLFPATAPATTTPPAGTTPPAPNPSGQLPGGGCPAGFTQLANGNCIVTPIVQMPPVQNPPAKVTTGTPPPTSCPAGQNLVNGACVTPAPPPPAAVAQAISQQMLAMATAAGYTDGSLNMDQWCWFYTQVTANQCPVDPGSIDPGVYQGAGVVNADGSAGDRTTPTFISTWLAIMQLEAPSAGLTGIGDLQYLSQRNNAWLT